MQARVLALALCLSYVSVSLTSRCSVETDVFLARELPSSYLALLKENSLIFKNMGTSLWKFVQNSGLRKFCFGIYRSSKRVIDLAR